MQDDGDDYRKQNENGRHSNESESRYRGVQAQKERHRKAKWQHDDTEQKSQMAVEKVRHPARHKVAHDQAHGDGKRDKVQQAEQPAVRTDKCREGALAFAAAVFNFKVLHKAHPEIP